MIGLILKRLVLRNSNQYRIEQVLYIYYSTQYSQLAAASVSHTAQLVSCQNFLVSIKLCLQKQQKWYNHENCLHIAGNFGGRKY